MDGCTFLHVFSPLRALCMSLLFYIHSFFSAASFLCSLVVFSKINERKLMYKLNSLLCNLSFQAELGMLREERYFCQLKLLSIHEFFDFFFTSCVSSSLLHFFFIVSCVLWHDVLLFAQDHHPNWLEDQVISHKPFTEYLLDCSRSSFGAVAKKQAEKYDEKRLRFQISHCSELLLKF